jgi:hypothetical protein
MLTPHHPLRVAVLRTAVTYDAFTPWLLDRQGCLLAPEVELAGARAGAT